MAQIRKPPVTIKLYRHFAAVTVTLAVALAFLTNGENPVAASESSATSVAPGPVAAAAPARRNNTPAYGQAQLVAPGSGGSFGDEAGPASGGSGGNMGRNTGAINPTDMPPANSENAGFTNAYLNSLSDEELDALLRALRESGVTNDAQRRNATAVMESASHRRSGHQIRQE